MGIDLYDFDEEHMIFRTTIIILPDNSIVHRPRTQLCCDLLKDIIYHRPGVGYIYANSNNVSQFKDDVIQYTRKCARSLDLENKFLAASESIRNSLLCCVSIAHNCIDAEGWDENAKHLYLTDEEKSDLSTSARIDFFKLDFLLVESNYSDAEVNAVLQGLFRSGSIISSGKSIFEDVFDSFIMKPSVFGIGVDLNKAVKAVRAIIQRR